MKRISFALTFFIVSASFAMEQRSELVLSAEEKACFEWFQDSEQYTTAACVKFSPDQTRALREGNAEELARVHSVCMELIWQEFIEHNIELPYSKEFVSQTLLKKRKIVLKRKMTEPTDEMSARVYTFFIELTPRERASVKKNNYLQYPFMADVAMKKYGSLLAKQLARLGLIESNPEAIAAKANYWHARKMQELASFMSKKNKSEGVL